AETTLRTVPGGGTFGAHGLRSTAPLGRRTEFRNSRHFESGTEASLTAVTVLVSFFSWTKTQPVAVLMYCSTASTDASWNRKSSFRSPGASWPLAAVARRGRAANRTAHALR